MKITILTGEGPSGSTEEAYEWTKDGWVFWKHTEADPSRPGQGEAIHLERGITLGEASDLLYRFGVTQDDLSLTKVKMTSPKELELLGRKVSVQ